MHGCSMFRGKMLAPSSTNSHINRFWNAAASYSSRSSSISNRSQPLSSASRMVTI
ncbi:hypothetical protein D3C81_1648140 [compost metagenome]